MKKLFVAVIALALSISSLMAQSPTDKIFEKYKGKEGFTVVTINQALFDMIAKMDTSAKGKELSDMAQSMDRIKILATDSVSGHVNLYKEVMDLLPKKEYKELMSVKENDQDVVFLIKEKAGKVAELLVVVGGSSGDNAIISIVGDLDLSKMGSLAKSMNIQGMENLEKLNHK